MLGDTERKVLMVTWSLHRGEWHRPDLEQLCRLSQRRSGQVRASVKELLAKGYVEVDSGRMRVLKLPLL